MVLEEKYGPFTLEVWEICHDPGKFYWEWKIGHTIMKRGEESHSDKFIAIEYGRIYMARLLTDVRDEIIEDLEASF